MAQKVLKVGSSAAVTIPKTLLEKLKLSIGDTVELEYSDTHSILVRPTDQSSARRDRVAELTARFIERYRGDLESLSQK